jgi:hypothetical protein
MGDHRLHSLLGAADCRVKDIAPMRSPFVSHQLARDSETIDVERVNSFVEMQRRSAEFELFDIQFVGGDSAEARMR